jgi:hypothetical protein
MRKRAMLSAGLVGVALLGLGCHKNDETSQPSPEASAGAKDTTAAAVNAARDTTAAATGAYGDSAAAKVDTTMGAVDSTMGAARDSASAALPVSASVRVDTSGVSAGVDSVRPDSTR